MKTRKEKIEEVKEYIEKEIGIDAWTIITLFEINSLDLLNTISINLELIDKDDFIKGLSLLTFKNQESDMIRIKQHLVLDVLMKIEIIIESFLVLINSLSGRYSDLPRKMTRYRQETIYSIIKKIREEHYSLLNLFGFPPLKVLPISESEKRFLFDQYQKVNNTYYDILKKICNFYEKFLIIYGKSKHGLLIIPELIIDNLSRELQNSSIACLDNRSEHQIRGIYFLNEELNSDNFNTVVQLNFNSILMDEIFVVISNLRKVISLACELNKIRIVNCGEGYFLFERVDQNHTKWFWPEKLKEEDETTMTQIALKILEYYYEPVEQVSNVKIEANKRSDIINSLINNSVTTIHNPKLYGHTSTTKLSLFDKFRNCFFGRLVRKQVNV